jgi:hypothetical protein
MSFDKRVSITKRNHIFRGNTDSEKVAVTFQEIYVDLCNIHEQINLHRTGIDELVSSYIEPSGSLKVLSSEISEIENTFEKMTYILAEQDPIF